MKKTLWTLFALLIFCASLSASGDIAGFWKSVDDKTGRARCMVAVYEYEDKYYGRIIGTYNEEGVLDATIYHPKGRAPGIKGNPYYCGMDIIWNLRKRDTRFKGKIVDPEHGKVYDAELWNRQGDLIVRGQLLIFGRNQTWLPVPNSVFNKKFPKPDVSKFVPIIPQTK